MIFGKKKVEAQELGRNIYDQIIRMCFPDPQNELSYKAIVVETLKISQPLPKSHFVEVIAGILFGVEIAIAEKFHFDSTMDKINTGILEEMSAHLKELGFKESEVGKLVSRCFSRIDEYFQIFQGGSSAIFVLGERFYWNVLGREEKGVALIEIATLAPLKMFFAQKCVREFLNGLRVI